MKIRSKKKDLLLIHHLVLHKIKLQFSDQLFGYAWAIINPLVYIFSFWFFAYAGFRDGEVNGVPFVIWVIPGLLAYRFVSTAFSGSASKLLSNANLIKETNVDVRVIPLIETLKECYVHVVVVLIMFVLYALVGYTMTKTWDFLPTIYYINFIYYWITAFAFTISLSYIISALGVIFRDIKNIINALMVPIFWMTPVLFPVENGINPALEKAEMIFNPFYYFIDGYRNTMIYGKFFYESLLYNIYIWILILIMIIFAKKLWRFVTPIISDLL